MNKPVCAYCKSPKDMTREHLWPASLHRRLLEANKQSDDIFWLARLRRCIPNEPKIRDVCAHCNNVVLSHLDAYICRLFDSTFVRMPKRHELVDFEHDYHLLKRWLLKMCYNSARIHNSRDLFALETMLPYILGKNDSLGRSTQMFLQLSYSEEVPEQEVRADAEGDRPIIFAPDINRVGHLFFRVQGVGAKQLRAVHLRSFTFYLAFFKPGERLLVQEHFASNFTGHMKETVLLRPSRPNIKLLCNGMGAWTSFKSSQNEIEYVRDGLS
jgi:hypothetical protein